jgi:hypothetical protein
MNFICHSPPTPNNSSNSGPTVEIKPQKPPEELGVEDGVIRAVDDAEEEHQVVVSCSLTFHKIYEFMYCLKSFIL